MTPPANTKPKPDAPREDARPAKQDPLRQAAALLAKGDPHRAEAQARRALEAAPDNPRALYILAEACRQRGDAGAALDHLDRALAAGPPDHHLWNALGVAYFALGQRDKAAGCYGRALGLRPDMAEAHSNLGNVLLQAGQAERAVASYGRAVAARPDLAGPRYNLGVALNGLGRTGEAVEAYRGALACDPRHLNAWNNLGVAFKTQGRLEEAAHCLRQALAVSAEFAEAHCNLGNVLRDQGRLPEAEASYRKALALREDYADAHLNLGNVARDLGRLEEAARCFREALRHRPEFIEAHCNLGNALKDMGHLGEAIACYQRALALRPDMGEVLCNLGSALKEMGRLDEAVAVGLRAAELAPEHLDVSSSLLFTLNAAGAGFPEQPWAWARRYGRLARSKAQEPNASWLCEPNPQRLRVGLVSGDLRSHPVGYFLESVLGVLDRGRLELFAYNTQAVSDPVSGRLGRAFSKTTDIYALGDREAAARIRADGIHVLLDLSGHTNFTRLPMFAWRPAPAQATWLGYFATTGLAEMDYLLADPEAAEPGPEGFSETLWPLPDTRLCFTPPATRAEVAELPALAAGRLTFGCFQNLSKLNDAVLRLWGAVLAAVPQAVLRIQCKQLKDRTTARILRKRMEGFGIAPERASLHGPVPREAYLAAYAQVDVALDTFPYPGGTTTCEALWMGVPTLTLAGASLLSRQGAGIMRAAGLAEWIAGGEEEYLRLAASLPQRLPELAELRRGLRRKVAGSLLFDAERFAANLAGALWGMWEERRRALAAAGGAPFAGASR